MEYNAGMTSSAGTVLCLTMNPSVDVSTHTDRVVPSDKLRCGPAGRDAGGGGLNVASVVHRLGGSSSALFPAGGPAGQWLTQHLAQSGLNAQALPIAQDTRENFTVQALNTGDEYRFVLPGPTLSEAEWQACLHTVGAWPAPLDFLVASGSLPLGMPADFYARLARSARARSVKMVLDSSGPALAQALQAGVFLVKPNLRELRELTGLPLATAAEWRGAAQALIDQDQAEIVALTMGSRGALVLSRDGAWQADALPLDVVSSVGAGDSFVGAMVWSLQRGHPLPQAFTWAMAAGSAALLTPGTGLCLPADVQRLQPQVRVVAV